ncbi:lipocalin-like domain-containing protein [Beijerinckia indica]|uniref:AttH domain-containing protein n=1 Tax=Beijerinckia indica subsp. indica (strain ATCC 9039 / DSM 1715 / NCIMB 8712) TaxID=395963 RepID=B2IKH7_BEII9|nr:lipocalin-like domain-containing protein [Beijerinckia indica]ACB96457.1 hypothetical protein Bind_2888 [Beijerinckia indica subsp. indica ATCC 9039]
MTSCDFLRSFDVRNPRIGTTREEWAPHAAMSAKTFEWWYMTTYLHDDLGNAYFYFLCLSAFQGEAYQRNVTGRTAPEGTTVLSIASLFSHYASERVWPSMRVPFTPTDSLFDPSSNCVRVDAGDGTNVSWSFGQDAMKLSHNTSEGVSLEAAITGLDTVLWHQDHAGEKHGIEGFIQQGAEDDFSFYYSLPRAHLTGTLTLPSEAGAPAKRSVSGRAWIDRQWGDFATLFWEWSSFRFQSGASVHIYNFYNGHQEAVYQDADGGVHRLKDKVIVRQNGYVKSPNIGNWVSWGWTYEFPIEIEGSRRFTVKPFGARDFMEYPTLQTQVPVQLNGYGLFEGAGALIDDETGNVVGVSINESADIRAMQNGPYEKNQN